MKSGSLRRARFLAQSGTLFATIGLVRAPARAADFTYKLAHADPVDASIHVRLTEFANAVKAETNGRMVIQVFPHSQLGSQTAMLAQLRLNSIQLLCTLNGVYSGFVPVVSIDSVGFAFNSPTRPWAVMDGPLGSYVRKEFLAKGIYVFEKVFDKGLKQVTSSTKPIRNVSDFANFKIRTPPSKIDVDLFSSLGAAPTPLDSNEMYTAMQTHLVDGDSATIQSVSLDRIFEVQKYVSITNHQFLGYWLTGNLEAWNALPPDIQAVMNRNAAKYALFERRDGVILNNVLPEKLKRQGMIFNNADTASMRARLVPYYQRWQKDLGSTAWDLLEASVGKLV